MNKDRLIGVHIFFRMFLLFWVVSFLCFAANVFIYFSDLSDSLYLKYFAIGLIIFGIPFFTILFFQRYIHKKVNTWLLLGCLIILFIIYNVIVGIYDNYDSRIVRFQEDRMNDLYDYRPFVADNKAASLNEPSSLRLTDPLPKLDGARALYPLYAAFAQAVYPERDYSLDSEVGYNNTIRAYQRLIERDADIIFVVSPSTQQLKNAEEKDVKMEFTAIGQDAFVFFVNINNPVNNLTTEQLQDIYSGKITNWRQVGGNSQSIQAFQRNPGSGSQSAFVKFMQQRQIMVPPKKNALGEMIEIIEKTADYVNYGNAVGFSFRYFAQQMVANNEIKLLSIDGVYPSVENIASGAYPLTVEFYAATLTDNQRVDVKKMLNWILSPQGQWLVEKTGYVPIIPVIIDDAGKPSWSMH